MKSIRTLWAPLLLCGLLLATVAGAAFARPNSAPLSNTTNTLTVSASDCYPYSDDVDYGNDGYRIRGYAGRVSFLCPVHFPEYGTHTISEITMYAYDNVSGDDPEDMVCGSPTRTNATTGGETEMAPDDLCSTGKSTANPRSFTIGGPEISPNSVSPTRGMYFWVTMGSTNYLRLYGFRISYSVS